MKAHKYIGKPMDRSDGRAKATGLAQYSDDLIFPNAFYGTILHSKYANARIISIETEKSKRCRELSAFLLLKISKIIIITSEWVQHTTLGF